MKTALEVLREKFDEGPAYLEGCLLRYEVEGNPEWQVLDYPYLTPEELKARLNSDKSPGAIIHYKLELVMTPVAEYTFDADMNLTKL